MIKKYSITLALILFLFTNFIPSLYGMENSNQVQVTGQNANPSSRLQSIKNYISNYCPTINPKEILKDIILSYAITVAMTIAHESGHSLFAKLLYGTPFHINIGGEPTDFPLLSLPCITIRGLNPERGFSEYQTSLPGPWKHFIINIAGPVFGIAMGYLIYNKLKKNDSKYLSKTTTLLGIFSNILSIIPSRRLKNDGFQALQSLKNKYIPSTSNELKEESIVETIKKMQKNVF